MGRPDRIWRTALLAVITPILVGGFAVSALANRWIFALWALASAVAAALVLRRGFEVWWGRPGVTPAAVAGRIALRVVAVLTPATLLFAWLIARHREIFDLGLRAVWPGLYTPAVTTPATYAVLAAVLALLGAVGWGVAVAARSGRHDRVAPAETRRSTEGDDDG